MQLGSVSTLGFVIARHLYQEAFKVSSKQDLVVEDMEVEGSENVKDRHAEEQLLTSSVRKLGQLLNFKVYFDVIIDSFLVLGVKRF